MAILILTHPSPFSNLKFCSAVAHLFTYLWHMKRTSPLGFCGGDGDGIMIAHICKQKESGWKDCSSRGRTSSQDHPLQVRCSSHEAPVISERDRQISLFIILELATTVVLDAITSTTSSSMYSQFPWSWWSCELLFKWLQVIRNSPEKIPEIRNIGTSKLMYFYLIIPLKIMNTNFI